MTRTLPLTPIRWPLFRIMVKQSWEGQTTSGGGWSPLEMRRRNLQTGHGFYLIDFERQSLPAVGRCRFAFDFGRFAGGTVGLSKTSQDRVIAGEAWDSSVDSLTVPDLTNYEIRIQAAPLPDSPESGTPAWRTVWWGQVDHFQDTGSPAALVPMGTRTFFCTDALFRTDRWVMNRHGLRVTDETNSVKYFKNAIGNPGYNVAQEGRSARLAANRDNSQYIVNPGGGTEATPVLADFHTLPGAGLTSWTDQQAIEHALAATRPLGQPLFALTGSTTLFSGVHPWKVEEDQTVHDFLVKICRRQRGRGCVFVDWDDDSGAPDGPLTARLVTRPMFKDALTFTKPSDGSTVTLPGAVTTGSTFVVDLVGDHRLVDDDFKISERISAEYDYLETVGERIQVVATLAYIDTPDSAGNGISLAKRWSSTDQTSFRAITPADLRASNLWDHVYQIHGLPRAWNGQAGNGNGTQSSRVDYRCNDDGSIFAPNSVGNDPDTSPALVRVLSDLPLYQGYKCSGATYVRTDGATEQGDPQRRPMFLLIRVSSGRYFIGDQINERSENCHLTARLDDDGIIVKDSSDAPLGTRRIGSKTAGVSPDSLNSEYDYTQLAITAALEMPHRVRFASGAPSGTDQQLGPKRLTIHVPDMHLWLIAWSAIYDVNPNVGSSSLGYGALREALGSTASNPGRIRDDRDGLLEVHTLAAAYYLNVRRPCNWSIRDFGLFDSYNAYEGTNPDFSAGGDITSYPYPVLGSFITTLAANGETHTVNCPVTGIVYDNASGTTRWECDWSSFDLESF